MFKSASVSQRYMRGMVWLLMVQGAGLEGWEAVGRMAADAVTGQSVGDLRWANASDSDRDFLQ